MAQGGNLFITKVIESIHKGVIRIPTFQRGFVWEPENVAYLMDSIYKGYPFGSVILWRTREQLKAERSLGPFPLLDLEPQYPIDYVLDGQQRLTSVFGVFQTEIKPVEDDSWTNIYFDMDAADDYQDSQFRSLAPEKADPERFFPIKTFFDVPGYLAAAYGLSKERIEQIERVRSAFQQAVIPAQYIETENKASVAIVFERVNRLGVELDIFQLLSAWTWSSEFNLQGQFEELSDELAPYGFSQIGEDTNLLLRCCAAIVAQDSSPSALIKLNGSHVRERFAEVANGIKGAIEFLRQNAHVEQLNNLPYSTLLVPLATFFAAKGGKSVKYTAVQRDVLLRWFWRTCFSRRYSAGTIRNLNNDIKEMLKLRSGQEHALDKIAVSVDAKYFIEQRFTVNTVHTNTFVLLLASTRPKSFVSGSYVKLGEVLQHYNRNEFHHLFPQAYLKARKLENADINRLANFAFMSSQDNKTLGGAAPSVYRKHMNASSIGSILDHASCPSSLFDDNYDKFLKHRAVLLEKQARKLMGL